MIDKEVLFLQSIIFSIKNTLGSVVTSEIIPYQQLLEELDKPIIRKFKKRKVHSSFIDNIGGVDVSDMQLVNQFDKEFRFFQYVIDIYNKYLWVIPLKEKMVLQALMFSNKYQINVIASQTKYGKIKTANFTTDQ